jgi:hypothetical protein
LDRIVERQVMMNSALVATLHDLQFQLRDANQRLYILQEQVDRLSARVPDDETDAQPDGKATMRPDPSAAARAGTLHDE